MGRGWTFAVAISVFLFQFSDRVDKGANFHWIFFPWPRFNSRSHVYSPGFKYTDCVRDVGGFRPPATTTLIFLLIA